MGSFVFVFFQAVRFLLPGETLPVVSVFRFYVVGELRCNGTRQNGSNSVLYTSRPTTMKYLLLCSSEFSDLAVYTPR